ncbi:hypothetical protein TNCV_1463741 [Trichonephila clavipes]|nr:hypothetical protein TNCV_1463741 [Trichonephila clavipes]
MSDIGPFLDIFWTISSTTLAPDQLASTTDDRLNYSHLRIVMPSPVQSTIVMLTTPLQTGSTVLSGQWDTQTGFSGNSFSGDLLSLRQQETDLRPAELWCACSFLLIGRYICLLQASYLTRSPCRCNIVRFHYFVRGGFVGHRSRASLPSSSGRVARFLGVKQGCAAPEAARVGVGSTKKPTRCCCFREVTLQLSPSLMELFR